MVVFDGGSGGMEPTAPIIIVDGGVGSLLTEAAVGWIRRWPCFALMAPTQRSLASRSLSAMVIVNGGGGGMEPTAPIIVINHGDGGHCWLRRQLIAASAMVVFMDDGRH